MPECVGSFNMDWPIYPVLKGSGFVKRSNLLTKPLTFKTGYITSRD